MNKEILILGNGQIWDVKGIDPLNPERTFEDLFSGRGLGQLAAVVPIFKKYHEDSKISGLSVTRALLSNNKEAKTAAKALLKHIANNAGQGIKLLTTAKIKKQYWNNLNGVVIGGGVSKGQTGKIIVENIKKYLKDRGFGHIKIFQAKFPGKESGFLGSIAYNFNLICKEGLKRKTKQIVGLGIDVGRSKIGIGALVINPKTGKVVSRNKDIWFFQRSITFPQKNKLKIFKDSDRRYSLKERRLGRQLREKILDEMTQLCCWAIEKAKSQNMITSHNIGIGLPGEATKNGYLVGSTHYLPFFRKRDNFHFSKQLENKLKEKSCVDYKIRILNDGIAAGLSNLRFGIGLENLEEGKYAFLGPGSGLGGFVGQIRKIRRSVKL